MSKSKSSRRWLDEHFNDNYVKRAQEDGYPSRAAYKLLEIQEKDRLIKQGTIIVDLGAAPGGWSMVASKLSGNKGRVIAVDLLALSSTVKVEFIQGDFTDTQVMSQLLSHIDNQAVDLVMSDMSPNISGIASVDQSSSYYLAEMALDFARQVLKTGGNLLVKIFQGQGFDRFLKEMRQNFTQVKIRKPKSSRSRSSELYLLGVGFKAIMQ